MSLHGGFLNDLRPANKKGACLSYLSVFPGRFQLAYLSALCKSLPNKSVKVVPL